MNNRLMRIGEAARLIGVSVDTLRRWADSGNLIPIRTSPLGHRYYRYSDIESYINASQNQRDLAKKWTISPKGFDLNSEVYCRTRDVFQARLEKLQSTLSKTFSPNGIVSLAVAVAGEIGNNSFDHNLGNWADIIGIFFYYDEKTYTIILADRGQGVLATLKRVRPELTSSSEALQVAFTETISGRHPETRGNGLKFVKSVIGSNPFLLHFQTGDAYLNLKQYDKSISVQKADTLIRGCFSTIRIGGVV